MPVSNYDNGFADGVTIRGIPLLQTNPGQVFYVNNSSVIAKGGIGGSDSNKGTYQQPFSTLDYAVGRCTADRGDVIALMPGHAETISDATSLALDVAGIAIVGLGVGSKTVAITLDTATTATIAVSAANIAIKNVVFKANFADIVALFTLTASSFHCEGVSIQATATNMNFVTACDTGTVDLAANGLSFWDCIWEEPDTATTSFLTVGGDVAYLEVKDCYFNLGVNTSDLPIIAAVATGKDLTNMRITGNQCIRLNDANPLLITMDTTTAKAMTATRAQTYQE